MFKVGFTHRKLARILINLLGKRQQKLASAFLFFQIALSFKLLF
ncbi:hypothetical protein PPEP_b0509 [Pseudoalteromonas peptidolytica F12-50-A1]|uniref:Uncharacterized protein n=1 Tax=Pseudoalteromonas peptidolytica F12-50-A1 TaxID=1315280 RepID=A0A8I0N0Q6_9GAMM|nr:hypothetical protein [Pseudoalteromonas peptidolytica F12-50-A1]